MMPLENNQDSGDSGGNKTKEYYPNSLTWLYHKYKYILLAWITSTTHQAYLCSVTSAILKELIFHGLYTAGSTHQKHHGIAHCQLSNAKGMGWQW